MRPHLTYANALSTLALFVALGGGAYAAIELPPNSVGTRQLKKNAVTGKKVKDHSLRARDLKSGTFVRPDALLGLSAGVVHGAGRVISTHFEGPTRTLSPFVTIPGGLTLDLGCNSSGYTLGFERQPSGNTRTFDTFNAKLEQGQNPAVSYFRIDHSSLLVVDSDNTLPRVTTYDVSSDAGYATFTLFAGWDPAANTCHVKARGIASP